MIAEMKRRFELAQWGRGDKDAQGKSAAKKLEAETEKENWDEECAWKWCRINLPRGIRKPLFEDSAWKQRKAEKVSFVKLCQRWKIGITRRERIWFIGTVLHARCLQKVPTRYVFKNLYRNLKTTTLRRAAQMLVFWVNFFFRIRRLGVNRIYPRSFRAPLCEYVTKSL